MSDPLEQLQGGSGQTSAVPPPTPQGNPFGDRLLALVKPSTKVPETFTDDTWAWGVNTLLGLDSKEAKLGESVALCVDAMFPGTGAGAGLPPLLHLARSSHKFYTLKKSKPEKTGIFGRKKK